LSQYTCCFVLPTTKVTISSLYETFVQWVVPCMCGHTRCFGVVLPRPVSLLSSKLMHRTAAMDRCGKACVAMRMDPRCCVTAHLPCCVEGTLQAVGDVVTYFEHITVSPTACLVCLVTRCASSSSKTTLCYGFCTLLTCSPTTAGQIG
jgi:hypothetical protein